MQSHPLAEREGNEGLRRKRHSSDTPPPVFAALRERIRSPMERVIGLIAGRDRTLRLHPHAARREHHLAQPLAALGAHRLLRLAPRRVLELAAEQRVEQLAW